MGKRFTETGKWDDSWFVDLPPEFKLAWLYVCDCCDASGVVDLSPRLANFKIGTEIDWDAFIEASGGRVERLDKCKLLIGGFIEFQYGVISENCKPHAQVIRLIEKHKLQRVAKGYTKGIHTLKEKEKDKDKENGKDIPPKIEDVAAYCAERGGKVDPNAWFDFYQSKNWMIGKNKMKDWQACVRNWERSNRNGNGNGVYMTPARQREANMSAVREKLLATENNAAETMQRLLGAKS